MLIYERAHAKINLTLSVLGKRADGHHNLASLVAFAALADEIEIELNKKAELIVEGEFASATPKDESNLIFQAMKFLGVEARVRLVKNIPPAAGLGGGSADCAAVLRGLARGLRISVPNNIFTLGADVPACYLSQSLWLSGAGARVESLSTPAVYCVLACPQSNTPTANIFNKWDKANGDIKKAELPYPSALITAQDIFDFCQKHGNDLTPFVPAAQNLLSLLSKTNAGAWGMSGSGASCFALYEKEEDVKAAVNQLKGTDFWFWHDKLIRASEDISL